MSFFDRFRRAAEPGAADAPDTLLAATPVAEVGSQQLTIGQGVALHLASPLVARQAQIDGELRGILRAHKLVVGRKGLLSGRARCGQAEVRGQVVGELVVKGRLTIYPNARVEGLVMCNDVVVWKGAELAAEVRELPVDARTSVRAELAAIKPVR
jgi:cytoskeletal protein CcmA (bactofilin family)